MRWFSPALFLILSSSRLLATELCEEVRRAHADAIRLAPAERVYWRYMTCYAARDEKERELWEKIILAYQLNALSTGPRLRPVVKVGPTLYRLNVLYYGDLFGKVYENLAKTNPYFPCFERTQLVPVAPAIEKTVIPVEKLERRRVFYQREQVYGWQVKVDGEWISEEEYLKREKPAPKPVQKTIEYDPKDVRIAAFLPAKELQELADMLQSKAPLIRADWFFYRTAISVNRQGDGYYDFLGIKSREDAFKLAAVDLKVVEKRRLDMAAIIGHSGVATNQARQVWWVAAYAGSWWQTFDVNQDAVGKRNLVRLLGQSLNKVDFDHDAEEAFFHLPNGLFGFLANNKDGTLQKNVPPEVASDDTTTSRDFRVHVGPVSCARCHVEGLRPVTDWGRQTYRQQVKNNPQFRLASVDPKRALRLEELYLSEMPARLQRDNINYALLLKSLNGLKPEENAAGIGQVWKAYADTPLGMDDWARDLGVSKEVWKKALTNYSERMTKEGKILDPVFAGVLEGNKTIRPHVEEAFSVGQLILKEATP